MRLILKVINNILWPNGYNHKVITGNFGETSRLSLVMLQEAIFFMATRGDFGEKKRFYIVILAMKECLESTKIVRIYVFQSSECRI